MESVIRSDKLSMNAFMENAGRGIDGKLVFHVVGYTVTT